MKVTPGLILYLPSHCQFQKRHCSGSMGVHASLSAHDYVESLHHNFWATLLYGKNDILIQLLKVHIGPRSPIGIWLHLIEKLSFNPRCSILHPSIHLLIHLFTHMQIFPQSTYSSICQYFLPSTRSSTCQCFLLWKSSVNSCSQSATHFSSCFYYIHLFLHFPPFLYPCFCIYILSPNLPSICPFIFQSICPPTF